MLLAFDLIEHDGADLRRLPLIERKWRLFKLIGKSKRAIRYNEPLIGDGPTIFDHVCRMGLEGIVSKRTDAPLSQRTVEAVAQVAEPSKRGSAPGARGGVAVASPSRPSKNKTRT
jgi:hypothetical protein